MAVDHRVSSYLVLLFSFFVAVVVCFFSVGAAVFFLPCIFFLWLLVVMCIVSLFSCFLFLLLLSYVFFPLLLLGVFFLLMLLRIFFYGCVVFFVTLFSCFHSRLRFSIKLFRIYFLCFICYTARLRL